MPARFGEMIKKAVSRMSGEKADTTALEAVPGVGKGTAEVLWDAGVRSPEQLAKTDESDLTTIQGIGKATARKLRKAAQKHAEANAPQPKKATKKSMQKTGSSNVKRSKKPEKKTKKKPAGDTSKSKKKTKSKKSSKSEKNASKKNGKTSGKKSKKKTADKAKSPSKKSSKSKKDVKKQKKSSSKKNKKSKDEENGFVYKPKETLESVKIADPGKQPWVPERSKIKAAIENGLPDSYLRVQRLLYLGAAHGYTISHIHTKPLELYAVEKSREMMQHFLPIAANLPSVLPIFADATAPDSFAHLIPGDVDVIFQDIAQRDQVGIFLSNCERFLAPHGVGILALKARNVASTAEPAAVFADTRQRLEEGGATVVQEISLEPYQEGHRVFVIHMSPLMDW